MMYGQDHDCKTVITINDPVIFKNDLTNLGGVKFLNNPSDLRRITKSACGLS